MDVKQLETHISVTEEKTEELRDEIRKGMGVAELKETIKYCFAIEESVRGLRNYALNELIKTIKEE